MQNQRWREVPPMAELDYSIVITAPFGFETCIFLDDWIRELGDTPAEIVVADSRPDAVDRSSGPIRHLRLPNARFLGLMTEGAKVARGKWVLVTEDHCRPLPGVIANYAARIARSPQADLIAGGVDNLTSRSPWSFAVFSIGLSEVWRESRSPPAGASNANLMIRRSAIQPEELEVPGGLLMLAVPRLARSGRMALCTEALVDHIVDLDGSGVVDFVFECTYRSISEQRAIVGPRRLVGEVCEALERWIGCGFIVPLRVARNNQGTSQAGLASWLRVAFICLAVARRLAFADIKRIARRLLPVEAV
jgi:hypothetical protein